MSEQTPTTTGQPSGGAAASGPPSARREWAAPVLDGLKGAGLGAMLLLGLLGACAFYSGTASSSFVGWAAGRGHDLLSKPGETALARAFPDEDVRWNLPPIIKTSAVVKALGAKGFVLGGLAGLAFGLARLLARRAARASAGAPAALRRPLLLSALAGEAAGALAGLSMAAMMPQAVLLLPSLGAIGGAVAGLALEAILLLCARRAAAAAADAPPDLFMDPALPLGLAALGLCCVGLVAGLALAAMVMMAEKPPEFLLKKPLLLPLLGMGCGALAGLAAAAVLVLRKGRAPAGPADADEQRSAAAQPAVHPLVPLGLAVLALFYNGYLLGNVAVWSLPFSRRRPWVTAVTWVIGCGAVVIWAWILCVDWSSGWNTRLPHGIKYFIYWLGNLVGLKE